MQLLQFPAGSCRLSVNLFVHPKSSMHNNRSKERLIWYDTYQWTRWQSVQFYDWMTLVLVELTNDVFPDAKLASTIRIVVDCVTEVDRKNWSGSHKKSGKFISFWCTLILMIHWVLAFSIKLCLLSIWVHLNFDASIWPLVLKLKSASIFIHVSLSLLK